MNKLYYSSIVILSLISLYSPVGHAKAVNSFIDSLAGLTTKEKQFIPTNKNIPEHISTHAIDIILESEQAQEGIDLQNITTPIPAFEEYLVREISVKEYSKFYESLKNANNAVKNNNLPQAIQFYTNAIAIAPFYYIGYMERGRALAKFNRYSLAIKDFTAAILKDPSVAKPYIYRATMSTKERQYGSALRDYQKAISIVGNDTVLLEKQGELLFILKDYSGAKNTYTLAIKEKPFMSKLYYQRALANAGMDNYASMLSDYTTAIRSNIYMQRLFYMRNTMIEQLEKKYFPTESSPIFSIEDPKSFLKKQASIQLYNPFINVKTIDSIHYMYPLLATIKKLQKAIEPKILTKIQQYISQENYTKALVILQQYINTDSRFYRHFDSTLMLPFLGYLNQMLNNDNDAMSAYNEFLNNTYRYDFLYVNYILLKLKTKTIPEITVLTKQLLPVKTKFLLYNQVFSYLALLENNYSLARKYLEEINTRSPSTFTTLQIASLYALENNYEASSTILTTMLQKNTKTDIKAKSSFLLGLIELKQNKMNTANTYFTSSNTLEPSLISNFYRVYTLFKSGKIEETLKIIRTINNNPKIKEKEKIEFSILKGIVEYEAKQYTQSILTFSIGVSSKVKNYEKLYYNIALAELKKKNVEYAFKNITLYLQSYPKDALGYVLLGDIQLERKKVRTALREYKKAIMLEDNLTYAHSHIAHAIYMMGILDTAKKYYTEILTKQTDSVLSYLLLAIISAQTNNPQDAIEYCSKVLSIEPKNEEAYLIRGMSYNQLGNLHSAYTDFSKTIQINKKNELAYTLLAEVFAQRREYRKALQNFSLAILNNPFSTEAFTLRGLVKINLGDSYSGLEDLRASKQLFIVQKDKKSSIIIQNMINNIQQN